MAIDNVMLGVLNAYFRAAAEAAGFTLKRSAHTTYVKESNDFTTALITPNGEQFAYPVALAAQSYVGINYSAFIASVAPWQDGDIAVSNCPYLTKGVSTHLPDYHMLKPIFADGRLLASAGADTAVIIWDMISGERKRKIAGWAKEVTSLQFIGATNQILTSAGDNLVRIVNDDGGEVRALSKLPDFMQAAASTVTASVIVGGGQDSILRVWDGTNGKELVVFGAN